jgi:MinD superfamily P-loop ATPase
MTGEDIIELTLISGKGGTGKTSIAASFASLSPGSVIADCDVDAADLHLILKPEIIESGRFEGGLQAVIDTDQCTLCRQCGALCRYGAILPDIEIDPLLCEGCGVCADNCPSGAIRMKREIAGDWFISMTRFGPFAHAKLGIAQENSGKLVSFVRSQAKKLAVERKLALMIADGSPGIGCPVISSIAGTDMVLAVTEPTPSGRHDLERVLKLAGHFHVKAAVCVNKYDINEAVTEDIKKLCHEKGAFFVGTIPYDEDVTKAMAAGKALTEISSGPAAAAVKTIWEKISRLLQKKINGAFGQSNP